MYFASRHCSQLISGPKLIPVFFLFVFPLKSVQPMEGSGEADGREETNIWVKTTGKRRQTIERFLLSVAVFSVHFSCKMLTKFHVIDVSRLWWRWRRTSYNNRNYKFRKPEVKHGVYFILFSFFFLQDWWHNPRLTTIRFRGFGIPYTKLKQNFFLSDFRTIFFHLLLLIDVSITENRKKNNKDDRLRGRDGELIASHKIQENRRLHSEDNQQFPSSSSLVFNRGLQWLNWLKW